MKRGGTISFSFPPFAGWVKRIILTCTGIFLLQIILQSVFHVSFRPVEELFALIPVFVMRGEVWQILTYSLLHQGWSHLFFNMLTLWFIGAYLERDWGPRRFIECYLFCVAGAALVTYSLLHQGWSHLFFNMLTLWFIGAYIERDWGPRRFIE